MEYSKFSPVQEYTYTDNPVPAYRRWMLIGCMMFVFGMPIMSLGVQVRDRVPDRTSNMETCEFNGQEVDCNSMFSGYPTPVQKAIAVPPFLWVILGGIVAVSGIYTMTINMNKVNDIKNDLITFANAKASKTGAPPDMSFLFYFDSRNRGQAEYGLMDKAYQEMMEWKEREERARMA